MKKILLIFLLFLPCVSYAIPSKEKLMIKSVLQVGDQTIFPRILVLNGEIATVEIDSIRFELQPLMGKSNDILIKARVFKLTNGEAELISSPTVQTKLGERVSINTATEDGSKTQLSLKMMAQRQK